eukprot:4262484-Pyramimonas_sp.AAC.1
MATRASSHHPLGRSATQPPPRDAGRRPCEQPDAVAARADRHTLGHPTLAWRPPYRAGESLHSSHIPLGSTMIQPTSWY